MSCAKDICIDRSLAGAGEVENVPKYAGTRASEGLAIAYHQRQGTTEISTTGPPQGKGAGAFVLQMCDHFHRVHSPAQLQHNTSTHSVQYGNTPFATAGAPTCITPLATPHLQAIDRRTVLIRHRTHAHVSCHMKPAGDDAHRQANQWPLLRPEHKPH